MKLEEYIDVHKLESHIAKKLVTVRKHESLPLSIYSYGRKAIYDNTWDDVTCRTRGLIVDDLTGDIVARPYEKFFSYETQGRPETYPRNIEKLEAVYGQPIITEKVNGCLGTYWKWGNNWGIATKGSFHSPHAEWATKWMYEHLKRKGQIQDLIVPEGYTPVFEIICQGIQPHVIKYPNDGLVLLNFINIETGEELDQDDTGGYAFKNQLPVTTQYMIDLSYALSDDSDEKEGYVATYDIPNAPPVKIKIKFPTFLENRKKFYQEQKLERDKTNTHSEDKYKEVFEACAGIVQDALTCCTERHEFVAFFNKPDNKQYRSICIAMLDQNNSHKQLINKYLEKHEG